MNLTEKMNHILKNRSPRDVVLERGRESWEGGYYIEPGKRDFRKKISVQSLVRSIPHSRLEDVYGGDSLTGPDVVLSPVWNLVSSGSPWVDESDIVDVTGEYIQEGERRWAPSGGFIFGVEVEVNMGERERMEVSVQVAYAMDSRGTSLVLNSVKAYNMS